MNIHAFRKRSMRILWPRDDETIALELLRRDPLFLRIRAGDAPEMVDLALSVGRGEAIHVVNKYGTSDPMHLSRLTRMKVLFDITRQQPQPFTVLSCYLPKPPTAVIYESALRRCREKLLGQGFSAGAIVSYLTDICVAHELYHHRERTEMRFVNLACRVPVVNLGFMRVEKSVAALSEIAAHSFAKELLQLPALPCYLDTALFEARAKARPPRE